MSPHQAGRRLALARGASGATTFDQVGLVNLGGAGNLLADTAFLQMMRGAEETLDKFHA